MWTSRWYWRCRGSNPRPSKCESDALPLSYIPLALPGVGSDSPSRLSWHFRRLVWTFISEFARLPVIGRHKFSANAMFVISLEQIMQGNTSSLYSSVAEHWSCKPGVESSILSGGRSAHVHLFSVRISVQFCTETDKPFFSGSLPTHHQASLAQWQSTGLVNQGSWVQTSQEALTLLSI